jgi:hypothetical protein
MIEDLTDNQLAEYRLSWVHDYGGPSLRYADRYDIIGAPFDDIECLLEDGASKDDIVLFLHEIASDMDEEDEHKRQWRIQHPIIYAINRLGWHLQMVGRRQWREHWQ